MCGGGQFYRIVYAWALDAPRKVLPEGVGLRVGGDTEIQYIVLQLHYKNKFHGGRNLVFMLTFGILYFGSILILIFFRTSILSSDEFFTNLSHITIFNILI